MYLICLNTFMYEIIHVLYHCVFVPFCYSFFCECAVSGAFLSNEASTFFSVLMPTSCFLVFFHSLKTMEARKEASLRTEAGDG